jgi:hypothetical protein
VKEIGAQKIARKILHEVLVNIVPKFGNSRLAFPKQVKVLLLVFFVLFDSLVTTPHPSEHLLSHWS